MTDPHNKCNNSEKVWNIARMTKMWHRNRKWGNVGENGSKRLARHRLPQIFNLWGEKAVSVKRKKAKPKKMQSAWTCICMECWYPQVSLCVMYLPMQRSKQAVHKIYNTDFKLWNLILWLGREAPFKSEYSVLWCHMVVKKITLKVIKIWV